MSVEKQEQKDMDSLKFLLWLWDGVSGVLYCDVNFHLWPETEGAGVKGGWMEDFWSDYSDEEESEKWQLKNRHLVNFKIRIY